MWLKLFFILWAILLALDIPWVMLNANFGIYRGYINGTIKNRGIIGVLWLLIAGLMALCITGILYYLPIRHVIYASMIFGMTVYFIFNATSLTMFQWSYWSALGDTIWGTVLCGLAATCGWALLKKWRITDPAVINPAALH